MVIIYPAIDLRGGRCVRLRQGDYQQETIYGDDPGAMARHWVSEGAQALHLVDLDGAKAGKPSNLEALRSIRQAVNVPLQVGGGLRSETDLATIFELGIDRAILGSRACHDPAWLGLMAKRYPQRLLLGLDAKHGMVATEGWLEVSQVAALVLARQVQDLPLAGIIYTDIAKDGMMAGPNWEGLATMAAATSLLVIASGGVTTADDVRRLRTMHLAGCIIGRALYEKTIILKEVLTTPTATGGDEFLRM
ncbi:MAG: 1-(5-phosphoribosyl)-5-[(5-phosphoribosylamino)methylideneamino]imidazole-4-carboxamide isomerase [Gemmatales bacterium]